MTPVKFASAYPLLIDWISSTLRQHAHDAQPVASFGFPRLHHYYGPQFLTAAKAIIVDRVPVPPLTAIGLGEFSEMERGGFDGITFLDSYFITRRECSNESLHFHELIHVVQWQLLGPERFLAMYADGLERCGYRNSPLEVMAYDAQARFDRGDVFDAQAQVAEYLRTTQEAPRH